MAEEGQAAPMENGVKSASEGDALEKTKTVEDATAVSNKSASSNASSDNDGELEAAMTVEEGENEATDEAAPEERTMTKKEERAEKSAKRKKMLEEKKVTDSLREKQNAQVEATYTKEAQRERLKYLMEQTELYSHFMTRGDADAAEASASSKGRRRDKLAEQKEDAKLVKDAMEEEKFTRLTTSPGFIKGTMRGYQLHGLNWMIKLHDNGINGILADEMGLGKTLQSISLLGYLKNVRGIDGPHMVIVPKSTLSNWMSEIRRWCPSLRPLKFHGSKEQRLEFIRKEMIAGTFDVIVTTYEVVIIEKSALAKFNWRYIVIDEAHRIKNENSILSQVIRLFSSSNRLLLTGTPLQNNLHELWALLNFLLPEIFGSADAFDTFFSLDGEEKDDVVAKLHKVLRPFLLRRLKSEVEADLPPKTETKLFVTLAPMQREWYRKLLSRDITAINTGGSGSKMRLLNIMMQLRKCCNHPYLFDGAEPGPPYFDGPHLINNSAKMILLDKLLIRLKSLDSRVLIFSQMTRMLDILEDYMRMKEYQYCRIDGSTAGDVREEAIDSFNKEGSEKFVFLLSTRAGGLGINLATADTVILYDSDWNPQVDLQAQDRAHRIGQKKPVSVYRFITDKTVEEKIVERAEKKLYLDALVIQQGRLVEQNKAMSSTELQSMIKFGADAIFNSESTEITDEDVDLIIARGRERSEALKKELNEKFQEQSTNLLNFSSTDDSASDSMYKFDGVEYKGASADLSASGGANVLDNWIDLPQRERKQKSYQEDKYYREIFQNMKAPKKPPTLRPPKQPVIHEFQFYPARLYELFQKETAAYQYKLSLKKLDSKEAEPVTPTDDLTEEEQKEKDKLLEKGGFSDWNRRDFHAFVRGCENFGRKAYPQIAEEVGKTEAEIKKYSKAFWKNVESIPGYERIVGNIEKGEQRLQKTAHMCEALAEKVDEYKDPWTQLALDYPAGKQKQFTEEADRFLLCMTYRLGYGQWDQLKAEVRRCWQFRFDWFIKSRTPEELRRRVDSLIRIIIKEQEEEVPEVGSKRKSTATQQGGKRRKK